MQKTYKIAISGQVQGVGFRPYVYVLAHRYNLLGIVSNNEEGVFIKVNGSPNAIRTFYREIIDTPPVVSKINQHELTEIDFEAFKDFQIIPSEKSGRLNLQLTPDFAICEDCAREISDKNNRRYNYPFTTCVNCGPRWAITKTFPFERAHTSISEFTMCKECEDEYTDPLDRRFHSQTNSCSTCGISLKLIDAKGGHLEFSPANVFKKLATLLEEDNIVALKNTGGYLLCCDATNAEVVKKLRQKKNRPTKPFAILYPNLEILKNELEVNRQVATELSSSERPIVIISKADYNGNLALDELAPGLNQLGIMLPYTGILELLSRELKMPIVATSGNRHGSPIISSEKVANNELSKIADYLLHHDLEISHPQDDSVVKYSFKTGHRVVFRWSRGYAPNSFGTYSTSEKIMAMGAHLKSAIAFLPNDYLYISQYLGNLDNFDVFQRFSEVDSKFRTLFEVKPEVILVDSHPSYQSALYGKELGVELGAKVVSIQHHKAHMAAVLGEHELFDDSNRVLGVVWDGTGYGDDGQIWGGEFFIFEKDKIDRIGHFEYFDWLAADKMSKEPRLSNFSLSHPNGQDSFTKIFSLEEYGIYQTIKLNNKLKTSSVGRLFDAVASLLNICHFNTYEGEAAILLENLVEGYDLSNCKIYCSINENGQIPTYELFQELRSDKENGETNKNIITNFLFTLASLIIQMADRMETKEIALSGGVFQNTTLVDMLKEIAKEEYTLYFNRNLSPNDENISFGQIMYYLHIKN